MFQKQTLLLLGAAASKYSWGRSFTSNRRYIKFNLLFILLLYSINLFVFAQNNQQAVSLARHASTISIKNINFFDQSRNRIIPILIYSDKRVHSNKQQPLAIINHGYTVKNSEYSFIANTLAIQTIRKLINALRGGLRTVTDVVTAIEESGFINIQLSPEQLGCQAIIATKPA